MQAEHEFAGSAWTTFTIGQLPDCRFGGRAGAGARNGQDAPPEIEDAVPIVEETVQHAPMASEERLLLPVALISLSVIIPLWLLHRFLRSETQAEHEEAMPSGRDEPREPASGPDRKRPNPATALILHHCQNLWRMLRQRKSASPPSRRPH